MGRRWIIVVVLAVVAALTFRVLTYPDPPAQNVPRVSGVPYKLTITRFSQEEGLVCPPFRLNVYHDSQSDFERNILFAEQADDVVIAQTPSVIYVFYNELVLHDFGGWVSNPRDSKPLLCDINVPACASEMKKLVDGGTKFYRICGRVHR